MLVSLCLKSAHICYNSHSSSVSIVHLLLTHMHETCIVHLLLNMYANTYARSMYFPLAGVTVVVCATKLIHYVTNMVRSMQEVPYSFLDYSQLHHENFMLSAWQFSKAACMSHSLSVSIYIHAESIY